MLRRLGLVISGIVGLFIFVAAIGLTWAHLSLRREQGPLPELAALAAPPAGADLPVSLAYINTASQVMPRSAVLDPGADPSPQAPYVMSHPSFVLRWADGRILLVDIGMTPQEAIEFGKPLEWAAGAEPTQAHRAVADVLADEAARVGGVLFTHLHSDHVGGLPALCARRDQPIPIFMAQAQARYTNYTTRPGREIIAAAGCANQQELPEGGLQPVPGFDGVSLFAGGGHTPDTQVILAWVRSGGGARLHALLGDVVNNIDGINHNIPKPFLYRWFIVPEDNVRLAELRLLLHRLRDESGATLLPAHDQLAVEAAGLVNLGG
jgi:glyoxylase-like metal-dependent hydrolase (beta-lactamase superfamily II)